MGLQTQSQAGTFPGTYPPGSASATAITATTMLREVRLGGIERIFLIVSSLCKMLTVSFFSVALSWCLFVRRGEVLFQNPFPPSCGHRPQALEVRELWSWAYLLKHSSACDSNSVAVEEPRCHLHSFGRVFGSQTLYWVPSVLRWLAQALGTRQCTRGALRLMWQKDNCLDWNKKVSVTCGVVAQQTGKASRTMDIWAEF